MTVLREEKKKKMELKEEKKQKSFGMTFRFNNEDERYRAKLVLNSYKKSDDDSLTTLANRLFENIGASYSPSVELEDLNKPIVLEVQDISPNGGMYAWTNIKKSPTLEKTFESLHSFVMEKIKENYSDVDEQAMIDEIEKARRIFLNDLYFLTKRDVRMMYRLVVRVVLVPINNELSLLERIAIKLFKRKPSMDNYRVSVGYTFMY